uniref:Uncharacterized protein n=1 Tax=Oryza punctata TaxID=4537 RepID=A0A0E0L9N8_ORYPU
MRSSKFILTLQGEFPWRSWNGLEGAPVLPPITAKAASASACSEMFPHGSSHPRPPLARKLYKVEDKKSRAFTFMN